MDHDESVWRGTRLASLESLDKTLRCNMCRDYLNAPVVLKSCSHIYCSECIRRALQQNKSCPECRKVCTSADLLPNRNMQSVIDAFILARRDLLSNINIESCLQVKSTPNVPSTFAKMTSLPYKAIKDKDLKHKLAQIGLPTTGDRPRLESRHKEFTLLWNAKRDGNALDDESLAAIAKEVMKNEKNRKRSVKKLDPESTAARKQFRILQQEVLKRKTKVSETIQQSKPTVEEEPPSVVADDASPSVVNNDTSLSVVVDDASPSVVNNDTSPSVVNNDTSPSVVNNNKAPSAAVDDKSLSVTNDDNDPKSVRKIDVPISKKRSNIIVIDDSPLKRRKELEKSVAGWSCLRCTFNNSGKSDKCTMCDNLNT